MTVFIDFIFKQPTITMNTVKNFTVALASLHFITFKLFRHWQNNYGFNANYKFLLDSLKINNKEIIDCLPMLVSLIK